MDIFVTLNLKKIGGMAYPPVTGSVFQQGNLFFFNHLRNYLHSLKKDVHYLDNSRGKASFLLWMLIMLELVF